MLFRSVAERETVAAGACNRCGDHRTRCRAASSSGVARIRPARSGAAGASAPQSCVARAFAARTEAACSAAASASRGAARVLTALTAASLGTATRPSRMTSRTASLRASKTRQRTNRERCNYTKMSGHDRALAFHEYCGRKYTLGAPGNMHKLCFSRIFFSPTPPGAAVAAAYAARSTGHSE